ncbi:MAG: tyrosine-type recombinase/integrase [Chloroflexi bacterium]|nr:tyrosine-type recombinase/integrase [Chloroflexota bacterium]
MHGLRHTAVSGMLARGVTPKTIQEQVGHSSISVTMDL